MSDQKDPDQKMTDEEPQKSTKQQPKGVDFESKKWDKIVEDEEEAEKQQEGDGAADRGDNLVAKIFNLEQFRQVCWECNELMKQEVGAGKDGKEPAGEDEKAALAKVKAQLKEVKEKIEGYMRKNLEESLEKKKDEQAK